MASMGHAITRFRTVAAGGHAASIRDIVGLREIFAGWHIVRGMRSPEAFR